MRIGIIGPTGAGKTIFSRQLAARYQARLIEWVPEKNEYLPYFYQDMESFALLSQSAIYSSLYLSTLLTKDEKNLVADGTLLGNLIMTETMRLSGIMNATEAALTFSVSEGHLSRLPGFDVYVVLLRSPADLLKRIKMYGRPFEQNQEAYFTSVFACYEDTAKRIFKNYHVPEDKVLFIAVKDSENPQEFADIVAKIEAAFHTANR